ncbi:MAG: hypothetical protein ABSA83_15180 [Verrucomicrobiota bacterium]|jgi:hypothetical protein
MTDNPPLFEEMLAAYPADKREFARRVYDRFANGDATEFFAQLFLLLDVYANYAKRIPQAVSETNQSTLASLKKVREEIGLLAQTVETRSVNLDNLCEETSAICLATQEKCEAAAERLAKLTKEIGQQVDTKAIVEGIRQSVHAGVRAEVITPFMQRTEELSADVLPTLEKIRNANEEAARVWPGRIWKMALASGLVFGLAVAIVATGTAYWAIKTHYSRTLADQIVSTEKTMAVNQATFHELAVADAPIHIARSTDERGYTIPGGFCLYIQGAQSADMQNGAGRIFFISPHPENELEQLLHDTQTNTRIIQIDR